MAKISRHPLHRHVSAQGLEHDDYETTESPLLFTIRTRAFLRRLECIGVQLDRVRRATAVVRVHADVEPQAGWQVADGKRGPVGGHVAGQRLAVPVVHLHNEPLAEAAVEARLAPDNQRRRRLVHHRTVFQAVRTP